MPYIPYCYKYVYGTISHVNKIVFTNSMKSKSPRQTFRSRPRHGFSPLHSSDTHDVVHLGARYTTWESNKHLQAFTIGEPLSPNFCGIFRDPQKESLKIWEWYGKLTARGSHNWGTTFPKLPCLPSMKSAANHGQLPVAPFLDFDFGSWELCCLRHWQA